MNGENRARWNANLQELCHKFEEFAVSQSILVPDCSTWTTSRLADQLPLSHSTSGKNFAYICASGQLLSMDQLALRGRRPVSPDCPELKLGTTRVVFFYVGPFRRPNRDYGLLFSSMLEFDNQDRASATPFDSGGLIGDSRPPDPNEPAREFLLRHELPVPGHRRYLCLAMNALFEKPLDYIDGIKPKMASPIGLVDKDPRTWTREVRIPDSVAIRSLHLQAVFAPKARVASDPQIEDFFRWCLSQNVDRIEFESAEDSNFEALRRECLGYIRRKLG